MAAADVERIETVRRFNRFYTRQIGLLREGLLESEFSLTEARVIWELAQRRQPAARQLAADLGLDTGYLSRVLRGLEDRRLIRRRPAETDRRVQILSLSAAGRKAFERLDAASRAQIGTMLEALGEAAQRRLVRSMVDIEGVLAPGEQARAAYLLRTHHSGDMGWVVQRHGVLYAREYGWDATFEALVADIVAGFLRHFDPQSERCWIAEKDSENVGSVFLVRHPERADTAQLRLLLVEPAARGLGIGKRLVEECTRFACQAGYARIELWTNSVLLAARRLYKAAGYRLVRETPHRSFGHDLVGETWELTL